MHNQQGPLNQKTVTETLEDGSTFLEIENNMPGKSLDENAYLAENDDHGDGDAS